MKRPRCDINRVARQCGVKLFDGKNHSPRGRYPGECYCKPTLRRIGRRYGEEHLRLVLRLIMETGNDEELFAETIKAVSMVVLSGLVEVGSALFEAFDKLDLGEVRIWAQAVCGQASTSETLATVLLWTVAPPKKLRA